MKTFDEPGKTGTRPSPIPDNSSERLSPMEEAEMFDNGPDAPDERISDNAVKGGAWLLGIVGIFAVAILFAWLVGRHESPLSSRSDARQQYALSDSQHPLKSSLLKSPDSESTYQFMAILVPAESRSSQKGSATQSSAMRAKSVSSSSQSMSQADADRIEREAREVIHGDFGDNPGRKSRLGADYAAVQARVNEILK